MGNGLVPYYMDSPKTDSTYKKKTPDNSKTRLKNFARCFNKILSEFKNNTRLNNTNSLVVPGYIGCNRGGGVWSFYRSELFKFAHELTSIKPNIKMKIVYFNMNKSSDISKFIYYTMIKVFIIFSKTEHVNNYFFLCFVGSWMQFKKDARGLSKNKNKKSLPIPVIPVSDTEEENVPVINSLDIMSVQEKPAIPETTGQPTQPAEKSKEDRVITVPNSDHNKEEEDFEMLEYSESFWEDGQRLTDS